ncbi:MAG: hypothetical protein IPF42_02380 [Candidatus Microthrix sp.]|nr:hypothetical protein [Candidatus Microthrix sp.]
MAITPHDAISAGAVTFSNSASSVGAAVRAAWLAHGATAAEDLDVHFMTPVLVQMITLKRYPVTMRPEATTAMKVAISLGCSTCRNRIISERAAI